MPYLKNFVIKEDNLFSLKVLVTVVRKICDLKRHLFYFKILVKVIRSCWHLCFMQQNKKRDISFKRCLRTI